MEYRKHKIIMESLSFFVGALVGRKLVSNKTAKEFLDSMDKALLDLEQEVRGKNDKS